MGAVFHDCPHKTIHCDVFGCLNTAEYYIGEPDGPNIGFKVCESCADHIVTNLPAQLKAVVNFEPLGPVEPPVIGEVVKDGETVAAIVDAAAVDTEATLADPENKPVEVEADADFACAQCDKTFRTHRGLLSHISQVHE